MANQHDETLEGQLFTALREQNPSTLGTILGTLLLTDADINAPGESGLTPIEAAFAWECPDEIRIMLIESGADVAPVRDRIGWAARTGSVTVMERFLDAGADPDGRGGSGADHPLLDEVVGVFENMFGDEAKGLGSYDGATPLIIAAGEGHGDMIRLLLERGADISATDAEGRTAVDIAQQRRHTSCVIALLDGGAVPPAEDRTESALLAAAENGDVQKMRELVRRGTDLTERDSRGRTATMLAAEYGHAAVVTVLLGAGADPDAADSEHQTALHLAALGNQRKAAQALIGGGAACDPHNAAGETPLMLAVESDAVEMFHDLLAAGADPLARDRAGNDVAARLGPAGAEMRERLQGAVPPASKPRRKAAPTRRTPARKKAARKPAKKAAAKKKSKPVRKTSRKKVGKKKTKTRAKKR